jgi:dTDP-4-dehydrorhamnose reductase
MKVLLLGSNGQLGSDIVRAICKYNLENISLEALTRKEIDVEDINNIENILCDYHFDVLINTTSYHKVDEVEDNAHKAISVNSHAVEKLAKVSKKKKAKFFHISTDYVFSGVNVHPYAENDCAKPINVYGLSKLYGENLAIHAYSSTYIFRVASLFGISGSSGKGGNFVETMIRVAKEKNELRVINDISMSPTSTSDIAEVLIKSLQKDINPGVYHLVNSGMATWMEFAQEIVNQIGLDVPVFPISSDSFQARALRPTYSVLNNKKIEKELGVEIRDWKAALKDYLIEKGYINNIS